MWYIPQISMPAFEREFDSLLDAANALELLTGFALFEYANKVKPDYSDAGGVLYFDSNEQDWYDVLAFDLEYDDELRTLLGVESIWKDHRDFLEGMLR